MDFWCWYSLTMPLNAAGCFLRKSTVGTVSTYVKKVSLVLVILIQHCSLNLCVPEENVSCYFINE